MGAQDAEWEKVLKGWSSSPPDSEQTRCDNAVKIVRNAIAASDELKAHATHVFTQGSYRNRVNVRQDSDVDIGVLLVGNYFFGMFAQTAEKVH